MKTGEKITTGEILDSFLEQIRDHLAKESVFTNTSIVFSGAEMRLEANIVLFGRAAKDILRVEGSVEVGDSLGTAEEIEPITIEVEKRKPGRSKKVAGDAGVGSVAVVA